MMTRLLSLVAALFVMVAAVPPAQAQEPLQLTLRDGVIEALPFALPTFQAEVAGSEQMAADISRVVAEDLTGTGLFRQIPSSAFISTPAGFGAPVAFADWRAINAQALVTGAVAVNGDQVTVKFRLYDVFSGAEMGEGLQFAGTTQGWRRMAHKVADVVYSRITGEAGYFDSRVVFIAETGPKDDRAKRVAIMDYDGANVQFLTDTSAIVLAPRFSPDGQRILYTSFGSGFPRINVLNVDNPSGQQQLQTAPGEMAFSPRFSRDGRQVIYSLANGGNTDIYRSDLTTGQFTRLTNTPAIETAPSFSPDGSRIVFESDRSGTQQLYIMDANGGEPQRISFGSGRYGTPVWSPRGDLIAFTKQEAGRFHIGVMRTDGSEERLLTSSFLDEGPTWAPNGRVIMFARETQGADGTSSLFSVDITGRNLRRVTTPQGGSDPSWGPLQP
ncbi:Tol-Pal system beta propeller repeat protein TolB [Pseudooctadecabacter jejudonensis]|uniref:Tol-Pal system protein TolB n=1 Tax=Pseudooctadecabacter jejudonensis TaxID=1391910 RepID=A0A1Y5SW65_9RHOB|nr:Tol-Pal system beta propeller repeat protein TolB [Pseudooctadecabacter jejudonensis]SLN49877.1 translocation protein TolB [Pseudooctadecabacter jejudonensis]